MAVIPVLPFTLTSFSYEVNFIAEYNYTMKEVGVKREVPEKKVSYYLLVTYTKLCLENIKKIVVVVHLMNWAVVTQKCGMIALIT